jgi:hypothetical protein
VFHHNHYNKKTVQVRKVAGTQLQVAQAEVKILELVEQVN